MANNIASERTRLGLSQEGLAKELGVSRESVKGWETGGKPVRSSNLCDMADLFGCSIDYLLARTDERVVRGALA